MGIQAAPGEVGKRMYLKPELDPRRRYGCYWHLKGPKKLMPVRKCEVAELWPPQYPRIKTFDLSEVGSCVSFDSPSAISVAALIRAARWASLQAPWPLTTHRPIGLKCMVAGTLAGHLL